MEGDPVRYGLGDSMEGLEDVEVLLVQGDWSLIGHQLWTMESLKTILKFDTGGSSCKAHKETQDTTQCGRRLVSRGEKNLSSSNWRCNKWNFQARVGCPSGST